MSTGYAIAAVAAVIAATTGIGAWTMRFSRTTSDFLVASRSVSTAWNASAIGGEYLSAASFLGVAGLVMAYGADMLWYPVGFVAGYVVLLLLVAAPLRRSGAYTLPDFAEMRLRSRAVRSVAAVLVVLIGWLYLLPQLQGAGLTLRTVTGAPRWAGPVLVACVVGANVSAGGMRGITFVQAFQFWLKMTAIAVPALVLLAIWHGRGTPLTAPHVPRFESATTVDVPSTVDVTVGRPVSVTAHGRVDGDPHDGPLRLLTGRHEIAAGTSLGFPAGSDVPHVSSVPAATGAQWALPLHGGDGHPLYATYSLILATFLGTMGLPHVLVRFYTNPDGRSARRTTLAVVALLGSFYLFPAVYGALGRAYAPQLLLTGQTDAVVLVLPGAVVGGPAGATLGALTAAGAFAAFLSTSSGLAVSVAGVLAQDVLGGRVRSFRQATLIAVGVPLVLSLVTSRLPVSEVVGMAFAVAASSFCPLLLLGIWWRRLTAAGAVAGLVVAGGAAAAAVGADIAGVAPGGWPGALLAQPAALTVPLAFAVMVAVSRATTHRAMPDVGRIMLTLHAPEALGVGRASEPATH
ncbi:MAG: cation acetate symporter [Frankiaceae bacterium]